MFAENLKKAMNEKGINGAMMVKLTGFSKAAISQYVNGINVPSQERMESIADVLGMTVEKLTDASIREPAVPPCKCTIQPFVQQKATLTCKEAATLLHKHESYVRLGLQQGRPGFEYGSAVRTSDKRWSYCIYAKKFTEVTGIPVNID